MLDIVIPAYNEEDSIGALYGRLCEVLGEAEPFRVIVVDDGSKDSTWETVRSLGAQYASITGVRLSRNFGHQAAVTAGLAVASGAAVVVMDADLQDPPGLIPEMLEKWRAGYDVVYGTRRRREGSAVKRACYKLFYRLLRYSSNIDIPVDAGDFCLMDGRVVRAINAMGERGRFVRGLRSWVGFRQVGVSYDRPDRRLGETQYTWRKLVGLAADGVFSFSLTPLYLAVWLGFGASACGTGYLAYALLRKMLTNETPPGWASLAACVLLMGGCQLVVCGILGVYIGRVYAEVQRRPVFVASEFVGLEAPRALELGLSLPREENTSGRR